MGMKILKIQLCMLLKFMVDNTSDRDSKYPLQALFCSLQMILQQFIFLENYFCTSRIVGRFT